MPFSFNSRETAVRLRDFADKRLPISGVPALPGAFPTLLVKTPSTGIEAYSSVGSTEDDRNEYEMGSAVCTVLTTYAPEPAGTARLETDTAHTINETAANDAGNASTSSSDGWKTEAGTSPADITVHNPYPYWIEPNRVVQAAFIGGSWVVHNDGNAVRVFITPSGGISGRSGTTLGKAECTGYEITYDGSDADLSALSYTADVFNMSTDDVAGSSYIQAIMISGLWIANWEDCA